MDPSQQFSPLCQCKFYLREGQLVDLYSSYFSLSEIGYQIYIYTHIYFIYVSVCLLIHIFAAAIRVLCVFISTVLLNDLYFS